MNPRRPAAPDDGPPPRLLVVKLSSLGDLFHALPAVHYLKRGLGAEVDWVTQPEYAELAACFEDVERVLSFPRRSFAKTQPSDLALQLEKAKRMASQISSHHAPP